MQGGRQGRREREVKETDLENHLGMDECAGTDGSLSGKALKFETAATEFFFLRDGGEKLVESTFFIQRYFLKETPAFNIFLLILTILFPAQSKCGP